MEMILEVSDGTYSYINGTKTLEKPYVSYMFGIQTIENLRKIISGLRIKAEVRIKS